MRSLFNFTIVAIFIPTLSGQSHLTSIDEVLEINQPRVEFLFSQLDLEAAGLEAARKQFDVGNLNKACEMLIQHFRNKKHSIKEPGNRPNDKLIDQADEILNDIYDVGPGLKGPIARTQAGSIDWYAGNPGDNAPVRANQDKRYSSGINRFYPATTLCDAYLATQNERYRQALEHYFQDFIISNPYTPEIIADDLNPQTGQVANAANPPWYALNAGIRMKKNWPDIFYALNSEAEGFSDATMLLFICSIGEHGDYLINYHRKDGNHMLTQMVGLVRLALCWPEFQASEEWLAHGLKWVTYAVEEEQVYPDGVQKELTYAYQHVTATSLLNVLDTFQNMGRDAPEYFYPIIDSMYDYMLWALQPDGENPLNGDSGQDRDHFVSALRHYFKLRKNDDYLALLDNEPVPSGKTYRPSRVFPWGGHAFFRDHWQPDAHWTFFDVGPFGTGHVHSDKLHVSISAFGKPFLTDSGAYTYDNYHLPIGTFREYFAGSFGHNVLLVDGQGQALKKKEEWKAPIDKSNYRVTSEFSFARQLVTEKDFRNAKKFRDQRPGIKGKFQHQRAVLFANDGFWIIADNLRTDRPRKIETLWHFHPECKVKTSGNQILASNQGIQFTIQKYLSPTTKTRFIMGLGLPNPQGWTSLVKGQKKPSPTIIINSDIQAGNTTMLWVMAASRNKDQSSSLINFHTKDANAAFITGVLEFEGNQYFVDIPLSAPITDSIIIRKN